MNKLRVLDYLSKIEELGEEALSADLMCTCGSNLFKIQHTGKQTRGVFTSQLVKKDQQLITKAICINCGAEIIIYNSKIDGTHKHQVDQVDSKFRDFNLAKSRSDFFQIRMMFNYYPDKMKENGVLTNDFEVIFVDISNKEVKKAYRLIEE